MNRRNDTVSPQNARLEAKIGELIKKYMREKKIAVKSVAEAIYKDFGYKSVSTAQSQISSIINGCIYGSYRAFSETEERDLHRLAVFLRYIDVLEDSQIIHQIKKRDSRFR